MNHLCLLDEALARRLDLLKRLLVKFDEAAYRFRVAPAVAVAARPRAIRALFGNFDNEAELPDLFGTACGAIGDYLAHGKADEAASLEPWLALGRDQTGQPVGCSIVCVITLVSRGTQILAPLERAVLECSNLGLSVAESALALGMPESEVRIQGINVRQKLAAGRCEHIEAMAGSRQGNRRIE